MKYEMTGRVRYSETGSGNHITLPGIINYFQDTSIFQSTELGVGVADLRRRNKAWMLSSWQIVVDRYPLFGETVSISTWATDFTGVCGTRNFLMQGADHTPAAYANSIWAYMDLERGRPVKPEQEEIDHYGTHPALEMEYAPRKIALLNDCKAKTAFPVRHYHIDTNGHVNNCQYVQMGLEVLALQIEVKQVRVEYKKPAVFGDMIYPFIGESKGRIVIELCDGNRKPFAIIEFIGE